MFRSCIFYTNVMKFNEKNWQIYQMKYYVWWSLILYLKNLSWLCYILTAYNMQLFYNQIQSILGEPFLLICSSTEMNKNYLLQSMFPSE